MCDIVGPIIEVIKSIGRPAKKYLKYHRKFNKYVDDLRKAKENLQAREADIRSKLNPQNQSIGTKSSGEVQYWLEGAKKTIQDAVNIEERATKGKYCFRSCLGKLVDEMTLEIEKVHKNDRFPHDLVINASSADKRQLPTHDLVGSTFPTDVIYEYLMGDEVRQIGVWGMGGIGKTTTVTNVYNKLMKETKFNKGIWVTVSQNPDILTLQKRIASRLKQNLSSDDDEIIDRAAKISEMLREQGRYVLILDDVWKPFSLHDVGIPEPDENNGCKLIITTRDEAVVRQMCCCRKVEVMKLCCCRTVEVKRLSDEDALKLFLSKVGRDMFPNPNVESIMKLIVNECSGLPLAIVIVAGSMKGISINEVHRWENALKELKGQVSNIQVPGDKVFLRLKFSYDNLPQQLQSCFLYCALYPEDYEIPKSDMIEYWLDEGLIEKMVTRKEMHRRGHSILESLEERSLLERVEGGDRIKMHDLVRDMALRITNGGSERNPHFLVKAGLQKIFEISDEQQWSDDLERVSLMANDIKIIPPNFLSSKCLNKLTSLLLSYNGLKEIPDSFFDHMPNLKILDLSWNYKIVKLPSSLSNLVKLRALLLSSCRALKTVPSLRKLVALSKLNLSRTSINKIPDGLEDLVYLRYLNLGYTEMLKPIPSRKFLKLVRLQYLELTAASLEEVDELGELKLEALVVSTKIRGLRLFANNNKFPDQYSFCVQEGSNFMVESRTIDFSAPSECCTKKITVVRCKVEDSFSVPSDIQQLSLLLGVQLRSIDDINGLKDASDLRECVVFRCMDLEYLFSSWCEPLRTLENLRLDSLANLKRLVEESGLPPSGSFSSLQQISLWEVHKLKILFPTTSILTDLCNLVGMELCDCRDMEEIIASEEEDQGDFKLPKLRYLELRKLPKLRRICGRNVSMKCDAIEEIGIAGCPKLERIPLCFSSLDNNPPAIPPSLKSIFLTYSPDLYCWEPDLEWWEVREWVQREWWEREWVQPNADQEWWEREWVPPEWVQRNAKVVLHPIISHTSRLVYKTRLGLKYPTGSIRMSMISLGLLKVILN